MTDPIGRVDYLLGADISGVRTSTAEAEAEILKSGQRVEADSKTRGYRIGQAIGVGIKGVAVASTALFAIASKGAIELQNTTADANAEMGLTGAEAEHTGKAINAMSGRNIQGIKEIGSAFTKVHTDLGLTGDEADATTERFLKFARATKQDAAGAVVAFDDVLDAWGLTAADATVIMDKLILSHQRYGGSIGENQAALAKMAPQLKALNLDVDDGIALLNLFAASGLDAATGQRALNTAITKLPPGETMDQFIARLSTIEDDGARAQEAIKVFGARAGPGLANAIRPGVDSLDDFKVSTEEATGATEKAADVMDSTFSAQLQLKIKAIGSAINDIGPGLTGVAAGLSVLGSFARVLKLDDLIVKPLAGLGGKLALKLASAIGVGVASSAVSGAAETGGEAIGGGVLKRLGNLGGRLATRLAAAVGIGFASSAVTGAAEAGGEAIGGAATKAIGAKIATAAVGQAVGTAIVTGTPAAVAASTTMGTVLGAAAVAAFALAVVAAPLIVLKVALDVQSGVDAQAAELLRQTQAFSATASDAALANSIKGVREQLDGMVFNTLESKNKVIAVLNTLVAEQNRRVKQLAAGTTAAAAEVGAAVDSVAAPIVELPKRIESAFDARARGIEQHLKAGILDPIASMEGRMDAVAAGLVAPIAAIPDQIAAVDAAAETGRMVSTIQRILNLGQGDIGNAAVKAMSGIGPALRDAAFQAALDAARTPTEIANAISSRRNQVDAAMDNLTAVIKGNKGSERAKVLGYLIGDELAKALKSKDPLIRTTAEETQRLLLSRLQEVIPASGQIGDKAMAQLNEAIHSKNPAVAAQARAIKATILANIKANTKPVGEDMAEGVAKGIAAKDQLAVKAARKLAHDAMLALERGWGNPVLEANLKIAGLTTRQLGFGAEGGPARKGDVKWVGEHGPEIVEFGGDAFITPADISRRVIDGTPGGRAAIGGARAGGGSIDPDKVYKVGEHGPEWFVSKDAGVILPNGQEPGTRPTAPSTEAAAAATSAGGPWSVGSGAAWGAAAGAALVGALSTVVAKLGRSTAGPVERVPERPQAAFDASSSKDAGDGDDPGAAPAMSAGGAWKSGSGAEWGAAAGAGLARGGAAAGTAFIDAASAGLLKVGRSIVGPTERVPERPQRAQAAFDASSLMFAPSFSVGAAMAGATSMNTTTHGPTTIDNRTVNAPISLVLPESWRGTGADLDELADRIAGRLRLTMSPRPGW